MQAALELVAEQRFECLILTNAVKDRQRTPHAFGRQVDRHHVRIELAACVM